MDVKGNTQICPSPVRESEERTQISAPLPMYLIMVRGGMTGTMLRLGNQPTSLGRSSENTYQFHDATVSRRHAVLSYDSDGLAWLTDMGSSNGTFVDGRKLAPNRPTRIEDGSRIQLGRVTVVLEADDADLSSTADYPGQSYGRLLGRSPAMKRLFGTLFRLEGSLVPVLVQGESGVGKELVASALHERSKVASGPFVPVNCGALARELVLSELFGHKRGAFTGAHEARQGAFELADGGTLFLDEIGELPLDVQPVLLRTLETGEVRPVGSSAAKKVQVRLVAATNRDLAAEVAAGRFRQDLYYRLAVVKLVLPPLRTRLEDVALLATEFARSAGIGDLPAGIIETLKSRPLTGNVRELRNSILAYGALGELPDAGDLRADLLDSALVELVDVHTSYAAQKDALVDRFTRIYLRTVLAHAGGNQTLAAKLADLDRGYLGRLLAKYDVFRQ